MANDISNNNQLFITKKEREFDIRIQNPIPKFNLEFLGTKDIFILHNFNFQIGSISNKMFFFKSAVIYRTEYFKEFSTVIKLLSVTYHIIITCT